MRIAAAVLACSVMASSAMADGFKSHRYEDRLDPKKTTVNATAVSTESLSQFGRPVSVELTVSCSTLLEPKLYVWLQFSEAMAIGERSVRWRVDDKPVHRRVNRFYGDSKQFYLDQGGEFGITLAELKTGKQMKVEADLPWAGNVVFGFDITGGGKAIAEIPCGRRPKS